MKLYEKILVYILLPFAVIAHGFKKFGKFARLQAKPVGAFFVAVTLLFSGVPLAAFAEGTTPTEKNITLGASHIEGAQASNVYFGNYYQSDASGQTKDPIKWRVLSNADGKLFLLSDQNLDVYWYHKSDGAITWEKSGIRSWLNGGSVNDGSGYTHATDNFLDTAFSASEQVAIADTTVVNNDNPSYGTDGGNNTTDKVFLLSIEEAQNKAYGFTDNTNSTDTRKATNTAYVANGGKIGTSGMYGVGEADYWWLRSPGGTTRYAAYVLDYGNVYVRGYSVNDDDNAVRPAFNLDLNSVLFTSAAVGGKPQGFNAVGDSSGTDWKLTLLDSSRAFGVSDTTAKTVRTGDTFSLEYSGATTGTNEYISAMIVDANGEVVYYGQLAQPTEATGTVNFVVPSDIEGGTYTLKLFNEQINEDYKTDYSSDFVDIALTIIPTATVSFNANGGTDTMDAVKVDKNSDYTLPANDFTAPSGYKFSGWATSANGSVISEAAITVTADITLYAIWEKIPAEAPTVTPSGNLMLTYKGYTDQQVSVSVTEKTGYIYSYQWYDSSGQPISGVEGSTYTVPSDLTAGSHSYYCRVTATRTDNQLTNFADSAKITVTVNKATANLTEPTAQNEITYGATLSTVGLTDGWTWADGNIVPTVVNTGYTAYYTPADTANYDWTQVEGWNEAEGRVERTVSVTVNKANPDVTAPTAKENLVYNGAEQELISAGSATSGTMQYALGNKITPPTSSHVGGWSTDIPKVTNADTYYVWYRVRGNTNYSSVDPVCITVKIDKVKLTISQTYTELNWYPDMAISYSSIKPYFSVTTADGTAFSYKDFTMYDSKGGEVEKLENADTYSFKFSLYNSDANNYEFENDTVTIKFNPFDLSTITEKPSMTALSPTYTGQKIFPQQTASGKLNFRIYILNPLRDAEKTTMYSLDYFDGYWEFEEISGKNCTEAGDAYVNIVGKGGNVVGSYEYKYSIKQKEMDAPVGLQAVDETISKKKDGEINGLTTAMEYSTSKYGTYMPVTDVNMLFEADTYYVRTAAPNANYEPSDPVEITIGEGRKLTVTIPTAEEQIGYTLTVNTNEINWHGRVAITFELADGYSKSQTDFAVKVNGTAVTLDDYGKYIVTDAESDLKITVSGVKDETAPEAEISISTNKWTDFLNNITFGMFFKETQDITITATDAGSGLDKIYYLISETVLDEDSVEALANDFWTEYDESNKPSISPNKECVVYVKVIDKAQNVKFISSDGLVFDGTAPTLEGIENGKTYYGDLTVIIPADQFGDIEQVTLDGETMTFAEGTYGRIPADNAEHIVVAADKAGNKTEYKITVYKIYEVTFKHPTFELGFPVNYGESFNQAHPDTVQDMVAEKDYHTFIGWYESTDGGETLKDTPYDFDTEVTDNVTLYPLFEIYTYTVTYKADGEVVGTVEVEHGADATAPAIPEKEGYTQTAPTWDKDGKNITADTEISAVYTINEYTITFMDENGVYKTLTYKHGETVTMPDVPTKDGYTVKWETTIDKATGNATVKAVYTENSVSVTAEPESPQTEKPSYPQMGDTTNLWLWVAILFVSGGCLFGTVIYTKKQKESK